MNYVDFVEYISNLNSNDSIGIHGVSGHGKYLEITKSILQQGLQTKGWGGILSNIQIFGQIKNLSNRDFLKMRDYVFSSDKDEMIVNIVFAFPETFKSSDGKQYFLGHFNPVKGYAKGQDNGGDSLPLNQIVEKIKYIPKEFIVGFYVGKMETDDFVFYKNPEFYANNEETFKQILEKLLIEHKINDLETEQINMTFYKKFGIASEYYRQLEEYIQKNFLGKKI